MTDRKLLGGELADASRVTSVPQRPSYRSSRRRTFASRLLGFGLLPVVATLGSLVLVPLVTRTAGPAGWGAIATGQALGAVGATLVQFGWAVMGPPKVAGADYGAARGIYFTSTLMRGAVLIVTLPVLILVLAAVVPARWYLLAAALCIGVALSGMSSAWFFIGRGAPRDLLLLEVGPRLVGTALSVVALLAGAGTAVYGCIALTTEVVIALVVVGRLARPDRSLGEHARSAGQAAREQWTLALSALLALGYQRAAVPLVAGANLAAAPLYATADRAQAYARLPLGPVVQAAQKWVYDGLAAASEAEFPRRARIATGATTLISLLVAAVVLLALPTASGLFFGPGLELGPALALPIAVSIIAVGASLGLTTFILVPLGRVGVVTWSGVVASVLSVPAIWMIAGPGGAAGALWVVAAAEAGVAMAQLVASNAGLRARRAPGGSV